MEHLSISHSEPIRRRGRPAGKSRKPLNREQRKARNALYERERRGEIAEATSQLIDAMDVDPSISLATLLDKALELINSSKLPTHSIHVLREKNEDLHKEIQDLEFLVSTKQQEQKKKNSEEHCKRGIKRKAENEPNSSKIEIEEEDKRVVVKKEYEIKNEPHDRWFD